MAGNQLDKLVQTFHKEVTYDTGIVQFQVSFRSDRELVIKHARSTKTGGFDKVWQKLSNFCKKNNIEIITLENAPKNGHNINWTKYGLSGDKHAEVRQFFVTLGSDFGRKMKVTQKDAFADIDRLASIRARSKNDKDFREFCEKMGIPENLIKYALSTAGKKLIDTKSKADTDAYRKKFNSPDIGHWEG